MEKWLSKLSAEVLAFLQRVLDYLPYVIGAIVILLIGWLLARVVRFATSRLLRSFNMLLDRVFVKGALARVRLNDLAIRVTGALAFWIIILLALEAASRALAIPPVTAWIDNLFEYVPTLVAVVVIVFVGFVASTLLRDVVASAARGAGVAQSRQLGFAVQVVSIVIAITVGLDQLGVDVDLLIAIIAVVVGAAVGGLALAFAFGAAPFVANVIAARQVARLYRQGETIKVGPHEGVVSAIGAAFVTLSTANGALAVPARLFLDRVSTSTRQSDGDGR